MDKTTKRVLIGVQLLVIAAVVATLVALSSGGSGGDEPETVTRTQAAAPRADRFDGRRAFGLLRTQVTRFGPRPAGSAASRRTAAWARERLPRGRFEVLRDHPRLRNVVGVLPGRRPAIVVGAHYDTEATVEGHVGANDGAAGTAAVLELARALPRLAPRGREVRFVLFDGEEEPRGCADDAFLQCALRGSKDYARRHGADVQAMVLLDYIAERRAPSFPREGTSDEALWARLRESARRAGVGRLFPAATAGGVYDDHTPFLEAGIPAIDVIDFDFPEADTTADDLDAVSERTLDAVGEAVLGLLVELRRG